MMAFCFTRLNCLLYINLICKSLIDTHDHINVNLSCFADYIKEIFAKIEKSELQEG